MLQVSQSSKAPLMLWGGSPTTGAPPTWPPPPPAEFWLPIGLAFLRPPPQLYLAHPSATPPPQMDCDVPPLSNDD
jgi:hypothetical protein